MTPRDEFVEGVQKLVNQSQGYSLVDSADSTEMILIILRKLAVAFIGTQCGGHYGMGRPGFNDKRDHEELCIKPFLRDCGLEADDDRQ
jgi:hypothetical protein